MAVYRTRVGTIAAKQETTEGTAETSALTQAIRVQNLRFNPTLATYPRPIHADKFGPFPQVAGAKMGEVSFDIAPTGDSSLANLGTNGAEIGLLLKACSMTETLTPSTSAQYDPLTSGASLKSLTIRTHLDGKGYYLRGCRGTFRIVANVGDPIIFQFTFRGVFDHEEVDVAVPAVAYQTVVPLPFLSASASVAGVTLIIRSIEIDYGNDLVLRPNVNNVDGFVSCVIANSAPSGRITFEPEVVGTFDAFSRAEDMTLGALTFLSGSGSTASKLTVSSPAAQVQLTGVQLQDVNGLLVYTAGLQFNRSAGDDFIRLLWSA